MKKLIMIMAIAIPTIAFAAYQVASKNAATVNQQQGLYLFVDCAPVCEYEFLGDVEFKGRFSSGQYVDVRNSLIEKCKKKYPGANGIIFHFVSGQADHADAILLK